MRAKALSILVANSEKALEESGIDRERKAKANERATKLENFVRGLIRDVNNMLTRFWFQKERKQMTEVQTKYLADFVNFTKTLVKDVRSLLTRFQSVRGQTFEEKLDREIEEIETQAKKRLKEFDETLNGRSHTLKKRLSKYVGNVLSRSESP